MVIAGLLLVGRKHREGYVFLKRTPFFSSRKVLYYESFYMKSLVQNINFAFFCELLLPYWLNVLPQAFVEDEDETK